LFSFGQAAQAQQFSEIPETINLPFIGEFKTASVSLPILTVVIGALDGFNPCAMWVLLFLISLLLNMKDRKRMWILGSAFIITSALVYFLFMVAWLNILTFLGFLKWIRIVIGLVALGSAYYNLRKWWQNRSGCPVAKNEKRLKTFEKLRTIVGKRQLWLALLGIILLAFAVNLVEVICSAGLPVVYTQILTLNDIPTSQHYLYLLLYIFVFLIDDLIIFIVAMVSLKAVGLTTKYTRASALIGGILMLIIGLLMIFKPAWLMFG
ncbi:hypothetical protein KKI23_01755, partial [Patescibacteria group bacterium]|nr:hypothetical protein [Patescibacteria group bacterium]